VFQAVLMALAALSAGPVAAAEQAAPAFTAPGVENAGQPLTRDSVGRLLDSYAELARTFEGYEGGDARGLAEHVQARSAQNKAEAIVAEHGFDGWVDWYQQFLRAIRAYTNLKMQDEPAGAPELEQQMAKIRNNPDISEEQKQQMLAMIEASQGFVKSMASADSADIEAVKPHMDRFEKVLDESGE
jgi:hypothetical protein